MSTKHRKGRAVIRLSGVAAVTALCAFGTPAVALATKHHKPHCRSGHVARLKGHRPHRHWACVRVQKAAKPKPAAPTIHYTAHVDPSFTQSPRDPLAVTYAYSGDATATLNGVTTDLVTTDQLPAGILNLYSPSSPGQPAGLVCSMNVGGAVSGGTCPVTYLATGSYAVTTEYIPTGTTPVTETDVETIRPYVYATTTSVTMQPEGTATASVVDQNGTALDASSVEWVVSDTTTGHAVGHFFNAGAVATFQERTQYDFVTHQPVGTSICVESTGACGDWITTADAFSVKAIYTPPSATGPISWTGSISPAAQLTLS